MKPKILLIADVRDWIFERHCDYLSKLLGDDFIFVTSYHRDHFGLNFDEDAYDLIYPLEFNLIHPSKKRNPNKYVTGIRSHSSWYGWSHDQLKSYLSEGFSLTHTVSYELDSIFKNILPPSSYAGVVQHGVDTELFKPNENKRNKDDALILGWAGNRKAASDKGFDDIIRPLERTSGVTLKFCGFVDKNLTIEEMSEFYKSIDVYVCASIKEGHNNCLIEAASSGNAIITTLNGTVPEYLKNEDSALIVDRETKPFMTAVKKLQDDLELVANLGKSARHAVLYNFDWKDRALDYKKLFERALNEL